MKEKPPKILAIQFRYLGDTLMMVPALRALRQHYPDGELHALVPVEAGPLLEHLPWLDRIWPMPRRRGRARIREAWPFIRALRAEHFDRSVDFGGSDRGAILSLLCGARERLGFAKPRGFLGRRFCFTKQVAPLPGNEHETRRLLHVLSGWNIPPPSSGESELHTDPALDPAAANILPEKKVVFHLAASQQKKEWPVGHWIALYRLAVAARIPVVISTGRLPREQALLDEFKRSVPDVPILPPQRDLRLFLAVLKRARAFVSGDTGPLHFAAGVGVPTIALFGPSSSVQWGPLGRRHQILDAGGCTCPGHIDACRSAAHCLGAIRPEQVLERLQLALFEQKDCLGGQTGEHYSTTDKTCKSQN